MIARLWKTTFDTSSKTRLIDYANQVSLPVLSSRPGNRGVFFFSHEDEWITLTLWDDQAALNTLAIDPEYAKIVDGLMDLNVLGTQQKTSVFEYHGGTLE